jgi:hypothetical protein
LAFNQLYRPSTPFPNADIESVFSPSVQQLQMGFAPKLRIFVLS